MCRDATAFAANFSINWEPSLTAPPPCEALRLVRSSLQSALRHPSSANGLPSACWASRSWVGRGAAGNAGRGQSGRVAAQLILAPLRDGGDQECADDQGREGGVKVEFTRRPSSAPALIEPSSGSCSGWHSEITKTILVDCLTTSSGSASCCYAGPAAGRRRRSSCPPQPA